MAAGSATSRPPLKELLEKPKFKELISSYEVDLEAHAPVDVRVLYELVWVFSNNPLVRPVYGPSIAALLEHHRLSLELQKQVAERKKLVLAELKERCLDRPQRSVAERRLAERRISEVDRQRIFFYSTSGFSAGAGFELIYRVDLRDLH